MGLQRTGVIFLEKMHAGRAGGNDRETGGGNDRFGEEKSDGGEPFADAKLMQKPAGVTKPLQTLERAKGIEPSSQPWEGHILPLNHTRAIKACF